MIKKLEKQESKKQVFFVKSIFLIVVVIGAVFIAHSAPPPPSKKLVSEDKRSVLGAQTSEDIKKTVDKNVHDLQQRTSLIEEEVKKQLNQLMQTKRTEIEGSMSALLYSRALLPIVSQFNLLPPQEKQKVKEMICK